MPRLQRAASFEFPVSTFKPNPFRWLIANCFPGTMQPMKIHFLGGADTVTGSQHLVEANGSRVLRDCGLFQGHRAEANAINSRHPFNVDQVHSMVLSHAHIDHCGNIPSLAKHGYNKPIHTSTATASLCGIMLRDSARIQEQDAAYLNQKTNRKGLVPVEPLYTVADAERALTLFKGYRYGQTFEAAPGIQVVLNDAGHILGAAITTFAATEGSRTVRISFAVDLGRADLPLIRDPEVVDGIDVLVLESTYGDRLHDAAAKEDDQLFEVVDRTIRRGGKVIIPSFALERAQEIIYHLTSLIVSGRLPRIPVFVDSPMATAVSDVFDQHRDYLDDEYRTLKKSVAHVLHPEWVTYTSSVEESKRITASDQPAVIISASGMCEHGRILHHLKHGIENSRNTVVLVGFQAANTLGRHLGDGDKRVRIFGDMFRVRADVVSLNSFSAHADRNDLLAYAQAAHPKKIFLVHGEQDQRAALAESLKGLGFKDVFTPAQGDVAEL